MAADVKATVAALQAQLRSLKCPLQLDAGGAEAGSPVPALQALSWLLLHFSKHVALLVTQQGLQVSGWRLGNVSVSAASAGGDPARLPRHLQHQPRLHTSPHPPTHPTTLPQLRGASDLRFAEGALRFARDALALRPALSAAQLLADGQFARAKAAFVLDVARACKERHNAAARQERLAALKACHAEQRLYGTAAAAAASLEQQQQQQAGRLSARSASSSIPRPPPPHVRVVSTAAQQQQAKAAAGMGGIEPPAAAAKAEEELSSEGSDGGAARDAAPTPTSVVAAAAAGAQPKQQAAASQQHQASQPFAAAQRPDASPADQPRALPPALLAARPAEVQPTAGTQAASAGPGSTQACVLPLPSYPQLLAAGPGAQLPKRLPAGHASGAAMPPAASAVLPPPPQVQLQAVPAHAAQPSSMAVVAVPSTASACVSSSLADQQTRRLVEDLQLRLALAEEAAASARWAAGGCGCSAAECAGSWNTYPLMSSCLWACAFQSTVGSLNGAVRVTARRNPQRPSIILIAGRRRRRRGSSCRPE